MARSAGQVAKSSKRSSAELRVVGERLSTLGRELAIVGAALVGPSVAAAKFAAGFETSLTKIETLVGINRETLQDWREDILSIAGDTAKAPIELADGLFAVTSAGLRGGEALEVLEQAAKAGAIGLGNTLATAKVVTAALQAYGTENLNASRATNILVATVREGNLAASELAPTLGRVLGPAATLGIRFEDLGAFIATYTRLGGSAAEATTSLNSVMTTFLKPTQGAIDVLKSVGLEMSEVREQAGKEGLSQALFTLLDAFEGNDEMLAQVIPNIRALRGVLATAGVQSEQFIAIQQSIRGELNLVEEGFARTAETAAFKFNKALNDIRIELTEVGATILPILTDVVGVVSFLAEKFSEVPGPVRTVVVSVVTLTGVIALLAGGLTLVIGTLIRLAPALEFVNLQILRMRIAMIGLNATILANPLAWAAVAVALTVAAAAYVLTRDRGEEVNEVLRSQLEIIRELEGVSLDAALVAQEEAQRKARDATAERVIVERELNALLTATRADAATANDPRVRRAKELKGVLEDRLEVEEAANAELAIATENLDVLTEALGRSEPAQRALVERLKEERDARVAQQNSIDGVRLMREEGIPLLAEEARLYDDLEVVIRDLDDELEIEEENLSRIATVIPKVVEGNEDLIRGFQQTVLTGDELASRIAKVQQSFNNANAAALRLSGQTIATAEAMRLLAFIANGGDIDTFSQMFDDAIARVRRFGEEAARVSEVAKELLDLAGLGGGAFGFTPGARFEVEEPDPGETPEERATRLAREAAELRQQAIEGVNQLGSLIETALQRQAQAQLDIVRKRIDDETEAVRDGAEDRIDAIRDEANAQIAALQTVTDARVAGLEGQLGGIQEDRSAEERAQLERDLALAFDPLERAAVEAEIREFERRERERDIRGQINSARAAQREQTDALRRESARRIKAIEEERDKALEDLQDALDAAQKTYEETTDAFTLESEVRRLLADEEFEAIAALLNDHVPEWRTAGLDYGTGLIDGIRASGIEAEIDRLLAKMRMLTGGFRGGGGGGPAPGSFGATINTGDPVADAQEQGRRALATPGVPAIVVQRMRDELEAKGVIPSFQRGGVMPHTGLAHLERGEVVLPVSASGGGSRSVTVNTDGMFRGATFAGSPRENMREARRMWQGFLSEELTRGAFVAGD